jgi:hypothetical protein
MKSFSRVVVPLAVVLLVMWAAVWAADLGARDARQAIAEALDLDSATNVRVRNISTGMGGQAVVEASIDAAFRLEKDKSGRWRAIEVRAGDKRWESFELIHTAIRKEKILRTTADMRTLATALEAFRRERGHYVLAETGAALIDNLAPTYLGAVIRIDAWSREFQYRGSQSGYLLASLGPDGKPESGDEIVFENGQQVKGNSQ